MSASDYQRALARILVYEGGKVDDPADPGGRTNKGVTQATYNAYRRSKGQPTRDVYGISEDEVSDIYKSRYWDLTRGDEMPTGLDLCVFDAGVNSGVGQSIKWLQTALGDHYEGQCDGVLGDKTVQAVTDFGDTDALIEEFCSRRLATLEHLKTWGRFGGGWHARIANVQKASCAWNDNAPHVDAVDVTSLGGHRKAVVTGNLKEPVVPQLTAHITTAAASTGTVASQAAQQVSGLQDTFTWLKYAFGGLTLLAVVAGIIAKVSSDAKIAAEAGTSKATVDLEADTGLPTVPEPAAPTLAATAAPAKGA